MAGVTAVGGRVRSWRWGCDSPLKIPGPVGAHARVCRGETKTPVRLAGRWRSSPRTAPPSRRQNPSRGTSRNNAPSHRRSRPKFTDPGGDVDEVCLPDQLDLQAHGQPRPRRVVLLASVDAALQPLGRPAERRQHPVGQACALGHVRVVAGTYRPASCSQQAHISSSRSNARPSASRSAIANWRAHALVAEAVDAGVDAPVGGPEHRPGRAAAPCRGGRGPGERNTGEGRWVIA